MAKQQCISIIVPVHNEEKNIPLLYDEVIDAIRRVRYAFEFIFVDDGSEDATSKEIRKLAKKDARVQLVEFARNFGKEAAVSAGLHKASGAAAIILDGDLQHPPALIPQFIEKWRKGADIVVGVKRYSREESWFKRASSGWFYALLDKVANARITPHATDYRLLDRCAIQAFSRFTERNRLTRGLIDWLGFDRQYIHFQAPPRRHGTASYSYGKLFKLAMNSFTAYSLAPLKFAGYLGIFILALTGPLSIGMYVEQYVLKDPLNLHITGTAFLAMLILFLIGIVLACLGLVSLYIARIHDEVVNRPLYILKREPEPEFIEGEEA